MCRCGNVFLRALSTLLWLAWIGATRPADAQETWKLELTGTLTGRTQNAQGAVTTTSSASGWLELMGDSKGNYTGTGSLSVRMSISMPPQTGIEISPLNGSGSFTVTGRRDGKSLLLWVAPGAIPCKGTITILLPTGRETTPNEIPFDPSALVAPGGVLIERREGAAAESKVDVSAAGVTARGGGRFVLSGGRNLTSETAPRQQEMSTDHWTLELDIHMVTEIHSAEADMVTTTRSRGSLQFPLPRKDGPATGQGPLAIDIDSTMTRPIGNKGHWTVTGDFVLDGTIKDDVLTFHPRLTMKDTAGGQTFGNLSGQAGYNTGASLSETAAPVSIRIEDGAEVVQNQNLALPGNMTSSAKMVWRLRGKKTELWRIRLDSTSTVLNGPSPIRIPKPASVKDPAAPPFKWSEAACGLQVRTAVVIDVEIENGKYKQGVGRSELVSQNPHSVPPGVYDVKPASLDVAKGNGTVKTPYVTDPTFSVKKGMQFGQRLDLDLYYDKSDPVGFWVGYEAVLNVKEAEKQIAYWNDPVTSRRSVMKRTVSNTAPLTIPLRISVMLVDGWKTSLGESTAMDSEVLSVQRIR